MTEGSAQEFFSARKKNWGGGVAQQLFLLYRDRQTKCYDRTCVTKVYKKKNKSYSWTRPSPYKSVSPKLM